MATSRNRISYAVIVASLVLLVGLVGSGVLSIGPSSATSVADHGFSTPTASEHQAANPATVQTSSRRQVESVTVSTFDEQVLHSSIPVLVDSYADWCGPCQIQHGILAELAAEAEGIKIVKVDVDQNAELSERFQIEALPTLLIIRDGQVIARHVGVATKEQLKTALAD
jgi:thioredoxin 1